MASKTATSPIAKTRMELLKKAKNDLNSHQSYVISMSMKAVRQSPSLNEDDIEVQKVTPVKQASTASTSTVEGNESPSKDDGPKGNVKLVNK